MKQFVVKKQDKSWSKPMGQAAMMTAAAAKIVAGRGPFAVTRVSKDDDRTTTKNLSRVQAISKIRQVASSMTIGSSVVVHNGRSLTVFVMRRVTEVSPVRAEYLKWWKWAISHEPSVHYSQQRPIPNYHPGQLPMYLDCSSSTITLARWAGHPAGWANSNSGNTSTLAATLQHIRREDVEAGDLVCWSSEHVATILDPRTLELASHGQERGPLRVSLASEVAYHGSDYVFLRLI